MVTDTSNSEAAEALDVPPELEARIDEAITHYPESKRSAAPTLLHIIQEHYGFINQAAIFWIAEKLDLQPINVLELVTFYPMYRQVPVGKKHIRVCRTLSCWMAGSYDVFDAVCREANIDKEKIDHHHPIGVSPDGEYSVEFAECLASCGTGPVAMVNDDFFENVKPERIRDLMDAELKVVPASLNPGDGKATV